VTAARFVLLVLLTASLDLATPMVPTTTGLQWDDDEELVHPRRPRIVRLAVASSPLPRTTGRDPAPMVKAPPPRAPVTPLERHPRVHRALAPSSDSASPPEPH
jgi:hypothetical protein